MKNSSGTFVKADLASVSAAAAGAAKEMPADFRVSITNGPGKTAYPISSFTWLLIPSKFSDAAKRDAIKDFAEVVAHRWPEAASKRSPTPSSPRKSLPRRLKAIGQIQ